MSSSKRKSMMFLENKQVMKISYVQQINFILSKALL